MSRKSRAWRNSETLAIGFRSQASVSSVTAGAGLEGTVIQSGLAMTLNGYLVKSTIVAALGGLLFGFDTVVISGTTDALTKTYDLSDWYLGVTVFSALCGTVLGAMFAGIPGDKWG